MRFRIERKRYRKSERLGHLFACLAVHTARRGFALVDDLAHLTVKTVVGARHSDIHVDARLVTLSFAHAVCPSAHRVVKDVLIRAARGSLVVDANGHGIRRKRGERVENRWQCEEHPWRLT